MKKILIVLSLGTIFMTAAVSGQGICPPLNWMERSSTDALMAYVAQAPIRWFQNPYVDSAPTHTEGLLALADDFRVLEAGNAVPWPGSIDWYPPRFGGVAWQFRLSGNGLSECDPIEGSDWYAVIRVDVFPNVEQAQAELDRMVSEFETNAVIDNYATDYGDSECKPCNDPTLRVVVFKELWDHPAAGCLIGVDYVPSLYHTVTLVSSDDLLGSTQRAYLLHSYSDYPLNSGVGFDFHGFLNSSDPGSVEDEFRNLLMKALSNCGSNYDFAVDFDLLGGPNENPLTYFEGGNGPGQCSSMGLPNHWVNTATRSLVLEDTDFAYSGLGPPIELTRTYHSDAGQRGKVGMFGRGWSFAYESWISKTDLKHVVWKGSGQGLTFQWDCEYDQSCSAVEELAPPKGNFDSLIRYENGANSYYIYKEKNTRLTYRYDLGDGEDYLLTSIKDENGNTVVLAYNNSNLQSIQDAVGRLTRFTFGLDGFCTSLTTPDGRQVTFEYSGDHLTRTTDLLGKLAAYTYNSLGLLTRLQVGDITSVFEYTELNGGRFELGSETDAMGNEFRYSLDSSRGDSRSITVTRASGEAWHYSYQKGALTEVEDPVGNFTATDFDVQTGLPIRSVDAKGSTTTLDYDLRGNLLRRVDRSGQTTTFSYDGSDYLTQVIDPAGGILQYAYDAKHNLVRVLQPSGRETRLLYDSRGQLTRVDGPGSRTYRYAYDAFGNLAEINDPNGRKTRFGYRNQGLQDAWQEDPNGNRSNFEYDANKRLTAVINPDGTQVRRQYECCALSALIGPTGERINVERDSSLNVTRIEDPLGNGIEQTFDGDGRPVAITDPLGSQIQVFYDPLGRPAYTLDRRGSKVSFHYDQNGNLISLNPLRQHATAFSYDAADRLQSVTFPDNPAALTVIRDALGRVIRQTNARGESTDLTYDADGRLLSKSGDSDVEFSYDDAGDLLSFTDVSGTTRLERDPAGRITKVNYPGGRELSFVYDSAGNVVQMRYPGGLTVSCTYSALNRLMRVSWPSGRLDLTYDPAGRIVEIDRSNGTVTRYAHDASGQILSVAHTAGGTSFAELQYTRNPLGMTIRERKSLSHRLPSPYEFSGTQYSGGNQAISFHNDYPDRRRELFEHDADGNLTQIKNGEFDGNTELVSTWEAEYNRENRLTQVRRSGRALDFRYNALGRRASEGVNGEETDFVYDLFGRLVFMQNRQSGSSQHFIYYGPHVGAMIDSQDRVFFYHFNGIGNTVALTDAVGGVAQSYDYDPFGNKVSKGSIDNPFTFGGAWGVFDEGQGLYLMRHRYYHAPSQRFVQRDPIGYLGGENLYLYSGNSPVDLIDPDGLRGRFPGSYVQFSNYGSGVAPPSYAWTPGGSTHDIALVADANIATSRSTTHEQLPPFVEYLLDKALGLSPIGPLWSVLTGTASLVQGNPDDAFVRYLGAFLPLGPGLLIDVGWDLHKGKEKAEKNQGRRKPTRCLEPAFRRMDAFTGQVLRY